MSDRVRPEYRICTKFDRPSPETYEVFKSFSTAGISDAFRKRQTLPKEIKPLYSDCKKVIGPALTVQVSPGDELLALKAIELGQPGDIIVVSGAYSQCFSFWGGIMSMMAKSRGIVGLITDGNVRDLNEIRQLDFPVYCVGHLPTAPVMDCPPGDLGFPIPMDRVIINPGDLIVADEDGVVVVPKDEINAVISAVNFRIQKEIKWKEEIAKTKDMILKDTVKTLLLSRTVEEC